MSTNSVYDEAIKNEALKLMAYDKKTDEELYDLAAYQAEQAYQAEYDQLFNTSKARKSILLRSIQDAEADYQSSIDEMNRYFEDSGKKLSDEALTRGLGRSTYALDVQQANETDRQQTLQSLLDDKVNTVNAIQDQIDALEKEYLDNQNYLTSKKAQDISQPLATLKEQRDETIREVIEYNNELILDYKDYQLDKLEADRDYEIALKKLNKKTYSSSGSKSSATLDLTPDNIMNEWNKLTGAGKLKFYNDYYEEMKAIDLDTYKNVVREIMALTQMGVKPATSKSKNYYK